MICRKASLSSAKRKAKESSTEVSSRELARVASPQVSPMRSRASLEDEETKKEKMEEASDRAPPPIRNVEMQEQP